MTTDHKRAHQNAYNEFIADYVERHGECKATRDEAHDVADWIVSMAKDVAVLSIKYALRPEVASDAANDLAAALIDDNGDIDSKDDARSLAAAVISVAMEEVK